MCVSPYLSIRDISACRGTTFKVSADFLALWMTWIGTVVALEIMDNDALDGLFSTPKGDRKEREEMENSLTRRKPCARQSSRIASDKMIKGGPFVGLTFSKRGGCKEPVADGRCKKGRIFALDARFPVVAWLPAESIPKKWPRVQQVFHRCVNSCQATMWRAAQCMSNMLKVSWNGI